MRSIRIKSKIFRNLFGTYVVAVCLIFLIMSSILMAESYSAERSRIERDAQLTANQMNLYIEERLTMAKELINQVNTSTTIRTLYMNLIESRQIRDAYTLTNIMTDIRMLQSQVELKGINEIVIFVDDYDKAYSGHGVLNFPAPFQAYRGSTPFAVLSNLETVTGIFDTGRISMQREALLYGDKYTYVNGAPKGLICVAINVDKIRKDLERLAGAYGFRFYWNDTLYIEGGRQSGRAIPGEAHGQHQYSCELVPDMSFASIMGHASFTKILPLNACLLLLFIVLSWVFARKHYEPMNNIEQLVKVEPYTAQSRYDEVQQVISGIQNLIVEKNGYQETALRVRPYAREGMLHGVLTGEMGQEALRVLRTERWLDLEKPFYTVAVVNLYRKNGVRVPELEQRWQEIVRGLSQKYSYEERNLVFYRRDANHIYLILNADGEEKLNEVFREIYRDMTDRLSGDAYIITMGVGEVQNDLALLGEACLRALETLDQMLLHGRGDIYYYEQHAGESRSQYYFPKNSVLKLSNMYKNRDWEGARGYLEAIYNKNRAMQCVSGVRELLEELRITSIKILRALDDVGHVNVSIDKLPDNATLEEAFSFYIAALELAAQRIIMEEENNSELRSRDEEVVAFIRTHCLDSELSLQLISDNFQVSNKYVSLVCKKYFGSTYLQYVQRRRIERAMELLQRSDMPLEKIAQETGYVNLLTFRRNFKQITGMNPSDFRDSETEK